MRDLERDRRVDREEFAYGSETCCPGFETWAGSDKEKCKKCCLLLNCCWLEAGDDRQCFVRTKIDHWGEKPETQHETMTIPTRSCINAWKLLLLLDLNPRDVQVRRYAWVLWGYSRRGKHPRDAARQEVPRNRKLDFWSFIEAFTLKWVERKLICSSIEFDTRLVLKGKMALNLPESEKSRS